MEILDCAFVEITYQVASPTHRMDIQNNQTDILWAIISTTSCYEGKKNAPSHQGSKTANPSFAEVVLRGDGLMEGQSYGSSPIQGAFSLDFEGD